MAEKDFCKKGKDENIASITEGKDKLKTLMSGGLDDIEGMEEAQAKMKEGFDILNGKAQTPTEYCYCYDWDEDYVETDDNFDPIAPTDKASCEDAFGVWICKKVESFSLQDKLGELAGETNEKVFAEKLASINKGFANTVTNFSDKLKSLNPALADFMAKGELPEVPTEVSYCKGYNDSLVDTDADFNPIAPETQEACLRAGGTWVTEPAKAFPDVLKDVNRAIGKATTQVSSFFSGQLNSANTSVLQSNGSINFGAGNKFQMPNLSDKIPKPGEIVKVCQCKRYDESLLDTDADFNPIVPTDKASCLAAGGEWICKDQPAPDLGSLLSPNGLPSFSLEDICNKVENIKVESQIVKDPVTNREWVEPKAQTKPVKAIVPKEPPAKPQPAPTPKNTESLGELSAIKSFNLAVTRSLESWMLTLTSPKWNLPKKDAKRVIQVLQYYGWKSFAENANADFEFVLKVMAIPVVSNLTDYKINEILTMFFRDYAKGHPREIPNPNTKMESSMWNTWKKFYDKAPGGGRDFDVAALIAWKNASGKSLNSLKVVPEYTDTEVISSIAVVEEEQPAPEKPAVSDGSKTVTIRSNSITYTEPQIKFNPNSGGFNLFFDDDPKVVGVFVHTQEDLDAVYKIYKAKSGTHVAYSTDRNSGRKAKTTYDGATRSSKYEFV